MRILLGGPPGAGKSSQSKLLSETLGFPRVSSSGVLREAAAVGDMRGSRALAIVADGSLAPSSDIIDMMCERLLRPDCAEGYVIDGFPRKPIEAESFLATSDLPDAYVLLSLPVDLARLRIAQRGSEGGSRQDWDDQAIERRLAIYDQEHSGVCRVFERMGVPVLAVDATDSPGTVTRNVLELLGTACHEHVAPGASR